VVDIRRITPTGRLLFSNKYPYFGSPGGRRCLRMISRPRHQYAGGRRENPLARSSTTSPRSDSKISRVPIFPSMFQFIPNVSSIIRSSAKVEYSKRDAGGQRLHNFSRIRKRAPLWISWAHKRARQGAPQPVAEDKVTQHGTALATANSRFEKPNL
jgi:hypothetical protein